MAKPVNIGDLFKVFSNPGRFGNLGTSDARIRLLVLLVGAGCVPGSGLLFSLLCVGFVMLFFSVDLIAYRSKKQKLGLSYEELLSPDTGLIRGLYRVNKAERSFWLPFSQDAIVVRGAAATSSGNSRASMFSVALNVIGVVGILSLIGTRISLAVGVL